MVNSVFGTSMALVSALSWAGCAVLFKKWGKRYESTHMNLFNTILSFIWLCILAVLTRSDLIISKESAITIALSGFLGIAISDSIYYSALKLLSPVSLTILSLVGSIFSMFWGYFLYGETLNKISGAGIFLILAGAGLIYSTYPKNNTLLRYKIYGLFLAIISAFLTTFSIAIIKPVLLQYSPMTVIMYRMLFSSIALVLYIIATRKIFVIKSVFSKENVNQKQIVGTSILYAFGGLFCSMLAVKNCNLVIVSSIMAVQPFFVLLIMILFFKHTPKINEFISILIIIAGLLLLYIN